MQLRPASSHHHARSRVLRRGGAALSCAVLALGVAACGSSGGSAGGEGSAGGGGSSGTGGGASQGATAMPSWTHGVVTPKGDSGFILMAQERKYFEQQGVDVKIKTFTGNVQLIQALLSGAIDSASSAPGAVIDADLKGGNLKIIGSSTPKLVDVVLSKSSIKTLKDLEGKTIGTSAPNGLPSVVVRAMVAAKGLDPDRVKQTNAGGTAQRFAALLHGRIDAAEASPDFVPQIKGHPELHVLARVQDVVPFFTHHLIVANADSLASKPDAAVRFLAAQMRGVGYALDHRDAEIRLAAKTLGESPTDPALTYDYDAIKSSDAASPTSEIPTAQITRFQQFRVAQGLQGKELDPAKFIDGSYREKALKLAGDASSGGA